MKKVRWLKQPDGGGLYRVGNVEENLDGLCDLWVSKGWAEYVDDTVKTTMQENAEDLARRERHVGPPSEEKAMHGSPIDKALKPEKTKKR